MINKKFKPSDEFFIYISDQDITASYLQYNQDIESIELKDKKDEISLKKETKKHSRCLTKFNFEKYCHLISPIEDETIEDEMNGDSNKSIHINLGKFLFDFLFKCGISDLFHRAVKQSCLKKDTFLRIRLAIYDQKLANIPWEFLYDEQLDNGKFICTYSKTPFTRFIGKLDDLINLYNNKESGKYYRDINVLPVAVNAIGDTNIKSDETVKKLHKHLKSLNLKKESKVKFNVEKLKSTPTWDNLNSKLLERNKSYNIIHFYGHGKYEPDKGSIFVFESEEGKDEVNAERFQKLFEGEKSNSIRLVILNACECAKSNPKHVSSGLAHDIVSLSNITRISSVLAMQFMITIPPVEYISEKLYQYICDAYPIDVAIQNIREGLWGTYEFTGKRLFATPVLFMSTINGDYFIRRYSKKPKKIVKKTNLELNTANKRNGNKKLQFSDGSKVEDRLYKLAIETNKTEDGLYVSTNEQHKTDEKIQITNTVLIYNKIKELVNKLYAIDGTIEHLINGSRSCLKMKTEGKDKEKLQTTVMLYESSYYNFLFEFQNFYKYFKETFNIKNEVDEVERLYKKLEPIIEHLPTDFTNVFDKVKEINITMSNIKSDFISFSTAIIISIINYYKMEKM